MAVKGEVNATVGLNVDDRNLNKVIQGLETLATKATKVIEGIGAAANKQKGRIVTEKELNELNGYIKSLGGITKGINTLKAALPSNLNINKAIGADGNDTALARKGLALAKYRQEMTETIGVAEKFRTRINALDKQTADGLRAGNTPSLALVRQREELTKTLAAYEQFSARQAQIVSRSSLLSPNSQKQLEPLILKFQQLKQVLNDIATDGRRTNFRFITESMKEITLEMDKQVSSLRVQEGLEARLGQRAKERALGVLGVSSRQEAINRERAAKAEMSRLTTTQTGLGDRLGTIGLQTRLENATKAYVNAKRNLETAIARGDSGPELDRLITRYRVLDKVITETIALQGRAAAIATKRTQEELDAIARRTRAQQKLIEALEKTETVTNRPKKTQEEPSSPFSLGLKGIANSGGAIGLLTRVGAYAVAATAIFGVINALKEGARFAVEFEDKLATLAAISNSTAQQMEGLSATILDVGTRSKFSVLELTEAATQLAQAGVSTVEIGESLESVSGLAAASGSTIAQSVDLVTSALGSFQLGTNETVRITDTLVSALNRSRLTVTQVGQAIQYAGATAFENNISFEQLVATVGTLSQAGVRSGSTAGTGLRQFLVDLQTPSQKLTEQLSLLGLTAADVDVKVKGLPAVIKTLGDAGFGASQAYEALELRAAAAFLILKNNQGVTESLTTAMSYQGAAALANERAMGSLSAQTQRFFNLLADKAGGGQTFTDGLANIVRNINDVTEAENESNKVIQDSIDGMNKRADALEKEGKSYEASLERLTAYLVGLNELGNVFGSTTQSAESLETAMNKASDAVSTQMTTVSSLEKEINRLLDQYGNALNSSNNLGNETIQLSNRFDGLSANLVGTTNNFYGLIDAMVKTQEQEKRLLVSRLQGQAATARLQLDQANSDLRGNLTSVVGSREFSRLPKASQEAIRRAARDPLGNGLDTRGRRIGGGNALAGVINDPSTPARIRQQLLRAQQNIGTGASSISTITTADRMSGQVEASLTQFGKTVVAASRGIQSGIRTMASGMVGKTPKERAALASGTLAANTRLINSIGDKLRDPRLTNSQREFLTNQLQEAESAGRSILGSTSATAKETKAAETAARKAGGAAKAGEAAARRAASQGVRNKGQVASSGLKASERNLSSILGTGGDIGSDFSQLPDFISRTDQALKEWVAARKEVLAGAIAAPGLSEQQIKELTEDAQIDIRSKQRDTFSKLADQSTEVLTTFVEEMNKRIEFSYQTSLKRVESKLASSQGTLQGLNNPLVSSRISNAARIIAQRQIDIDTDAVRVQTLGSTKVKLSDKGEQLRTAESSLETARTRLAAATYGGDKDQIAATSKAFREQTLEVERLQSEIEVLNARLVTMNAEQAAISAKPVNFSQGIQQAVEAFRIQNDVGSSLQTKVINGLGGVLEDTSQAFQGFFTSIVRGTSSVGDAFGNMAGAVIDSIAAMAAKAVATQIFGLLLSFIPGAGAGTSSIVTTGASAAAAKFFGYRGGEFTGHGMGGFQRYNRGGMVSMGLPTRDNVPALLSKGEFVMRRSSVESVGRDLLQDMNKRGAGALGKLGGDNIVMPQSQLQSNVYVVLPEEKPTLGPNDVLAVISRDVLRGGQTKALIKQVAAGG